MTHTAKSLAALALIGVRESLSNAAANPVEGVPEFKGSHNCQANLERDHQRKTNGHWFDDETLRYFKTRFPSGFWDVEQARVTLFVTTERPPTGERAATVRAYLWDNGRIATLGPFCEVSLRVADKALRLIWETLKADEPLTPR